MFDSTIATTKDPVMAAPALKFEPENRVEERIARIETTVEHIRSDVSELKTDVRRLNDKIDGVDQRLTSKIESVDQKLTDKIESVDRKLTGKIDALNEMIAARFTKLEVGRWVDRAWYLGIVGGVLTFMAKALKWI